MPVNIKHDEQGREIPQGESKTAALMKLRPQDNITDTIRRMVRTQISSAFAAQGQETFEEADDFAVGDDQEVLDARTKYELDDEKPGYEPGPAAKRTSAAVPEPPAPVPPKTASSGSGGGERRKKKTAVEPEPEDEA